MTSTFSNKKTKVIVVDPSGPVRQMMADTVRSTMGFEAVEGKSSIQDVLAQLETEPADWIVLPLMADQPANALHLLKLCTEHKELRHVRVSLVVSEEEAYVLPTAYGLGLFSSHHKPFTKDTLTSELKNLTSVLEQSKFNETQTAAHFLRQHLRTVKDYGAQAQLEKSLLDIYPGDPAILLNLAEPQYHLGKQDQSRKTLTQVKLLAEKLVDKVDAMGKSLFGDQNWPQEQPTSNTRDDPAVNVLGVKSVIVIDSDDTCSKAVEDILKTLGCTTVQRFVDGNAAWAYLEKNPEPDMIITEWRVPKLTGPLLIQRIRQHGFLNVPMIVLSSLIKPEDMPLVRELSVAEIVAKPLNKDTFLPGLIWTVQQERMPTEQAVLERKIRTFLRANKRGDAEPLRVQLFADKATPVARRRLIEAEFAYADGNYAAARDAAVEALKLTGDSIHVLNLLGKVFMRLSIYEAALKCFKKAQEMSPGNIERLCLIAETQTELGDDEAAKDALADAKAMDGGAKVVAETGARVAITKGDSQSAKKIMSAFESIDNIVAYMNNKAVAMAKCGQNIEAIDVYKTTLDSIPDSQVDSRVKVLYNLALAEIRGDDYTSALKHLDDVLAVEGNKIAKKTASLKERLKQAVDKGTAFKLRSLDAPVLAKVAADPLAPAVAPAAGTASAPSGAVGPDDKDADRSAHDEEQRQMVALVEAKRGDLCCYMIFSNPNQEDARVNALLAKAPRFQARVAIERAEAMQQQKQGA